jgi:uncharacterized protein (TIGR02246 family)
VFLVLLTSGTVGADDPKDEVAKLSKAYNAAIKARDVKALTKLFDDDGRFITDDGRLVDKKGYIAEFVHDKTYDSTASEEVTVRVVGNVVIETGTWTATGMKEGKPFRKQNRYMTVWVKKGDTWVVSAEQASPITTGR